jgi:hypothetical protein
MFHMHVYRRTKLSRNFFFEIEPKKTLPNFRSSLPVLKMCLKIRDRYKCLQKGSIKDHKHCIRQMCANRMPNIQRTTIADGNVRLFDEFAGDVVQGGGDET